MKKWINLAVLVYLWLTLTHTERSLASNESERGKKSSRLSKTPKRLRRSDSFFDLHFDLHARDTDNRMGENVTR